MRAVWQERFGEPSEVLQIREVRAPEPKAGQVRVRMLASPINPSDLMTVRGVYGKLPTLPATPGFEGVGMVEAAGPGIYGRILIGRRVAVLNGETGTWAEQVIVPARQVVPISDAIPLEQAAMFFVNPVTAYALTRAWLNVPAGAWLLQSAAGSSLGRMVIRLGRHFGLRTFNVVRRSEQIDELRGLGADVVIATDRQDLAAEIRRVTNGEGMRFAIDCVGGQTGSVIAQNLAIGGRMVIFGSMSEEPISFPPRALLTPTARIEGFWLARWMPGLPLLRRVAVVRAVGRLIREGVLASEVGESFPLERIVEAVRRAEQPARGGKAWLRIGDH